MWKYAKKAVMGQCHAQKANIELLCVACLKYRAKVLQNCFVYNRNTLINPVKALSNLLFRCLKTRKTGQIGGNFLEIS